MSVWTKRAERGSTWLIHLIAWLARVVGRPVCRLLLYPIVLYFMLFDGNTRRASAAFLRAARGHPTRWRDSFNHIYCFAATLLDRVYLARGEFSRFDLQIEGLEILDAALRPDRDDEQHAGSHRVKTLLLTLRTHVTTALRQLQYRGHERS